MRELMLTPGLCSIGLNQHTGCSHRAMATAEAESRTHKEPRRRRTITQVKQIFPSWKSTLGHPNKLKRALKALVLVLSTCIALAVVTAAFLLMAVPVTKICDLNDAQVILFTATIATPTPAPSQ